MWSTQGDDVKVLVWKWIVNLKLYHIKKKKKKRER